MWLNNDYLVPYLNGIAYSHKPPLLFWLINLGWKIFGVNDWWPRLVPSLFSLATVFVTHQIALKLWPERLSIAQNAPLILLSSALWITYSTALMFDMLVAFFTALGALGLLIASQQRSYKGWFLFALALGGGLLAKGPTIFLQLLPLALMAPWWSKQRVLNAKNWFLPILYSTLAGAAVGLAWAIPAGIRGGEVYQHAIFWGQTADRMVDSFAHKRPFWWYLSIMPALFFPWFLWGAFWKGLMNPNRAAEYGLRFGIAWVIPVLLGFSLISGKQVHYVLPIFPAFALLLARYAENSPMYTRLQTLPISLMIIVIGATLLGLPLFIHYLNHSATWLAQIPVWLGGSLILIGIGIFFLPTNTKNISSTVKQLTFLSTLAVVAVMCGLMQAAGEAYDVRPISRQVKMLETRNIPVAYLGRYPGIYNFVGRLNQSPEVVTHATLADWFVKHPHGKVILFFHDIKEAKQHKTEFTQPYKGMAIALMNRDQWQALQKTPKESASE
ncbi:MAG TPA: glycosyltransferase family 39 protein [Methylophilus sp.]|nr:glycosyltransferase family 39 protein [Methylophilus sp.]HQQ32594.1 glycosyltransferase family 39 protein [Methylophilus sp.]